MVVSLSPHSRLCFVTKFNISLPATRPISMFFNKIVLWIRQSVVKLMTGVQCAQKPGNAEVPNSIDLLTDRQVLALTAWGEWRSGAKPGMTCILNVVCNRLASGITWWGNDKRAICLHPYQFSCWNQDNPEHFKMLAVNPKDPDYQIALGLAGLAIAGILPDLTNGATSYFDNSIPAPKWAVDKTPCFIIYPMQFYKNV